MNPARQPDGLRWGAHPRTTRPRPVGSDQTGSALTARLVEDLTREIEARRAAEAELRVALGEVEALKNRLEAENVVLREEISGTSQFEELIGTSPALRTVTLRVKQVAATDAIVLIEGETGTGKELVARAIHRLSGRKDRPFVKVNCASLPATLIESELFGHERGAFTGALVRKLGRFELADRGTLFLDEIGDLPVELQAKLLRVLQEGEFERLGSERTTKVDVRVIAATNRDLEKELGAGRFRDDLYYRLKVFPILVPPLRSRIEDIPFLVWYFISKHQTKLGRHIDRVARSAMDALTQARWPGNVRELEHVIERALIVAEGATLALDDVRDAAASPAPADAIATHDLQDVERRHILRVLEDCGWKVKGPANAAARLGLKPSTLRSRMKKLHIERPGMVDRWAFGSPQSGSR